MQAYKVTPLKEDPELVKQVTRRREAGESIKAIAEDLGMAAGKTAMQVIIGTAPRVQIDDPAKLARAIAKDRKAGTDWAHLAARYGVSEGTVRAAYTAATGQPFAETNTPDRQYGPRKQEAETGGQTGCP